MTNRKKLDAMRWTPLTNREALHFVPLPIPSFRFVESCAYRSCVDVDHVYVPVQANESENGVWKVNIRMNDDTPERICPLPNPENELFGSKLLKDGRMIICSFQNQRLLIVDVHQGALLDEISLPCAPNDVAVDPDNESILYVCGNSSQYGDQHTLNALRVASYDLGDIYKVDLDAPSGQRVEMIASALEVMAGIAVVGKNLWVSELYRLVRVDPKTGAWVRMEGTHNPQFLADNLTHFSGSGDLLLLPMYRRASRLEVLLSGWNAGARLLYYLLREWLPAVAERWARPGEYEDVRFGLYNVRSRMGHLFLLDLNPQQIFGDDRPFPHKNFDGAVTHIERADDMLVFINYRSSQILMIPVDRLPLDDPQHLSPIVCAI